MPFSPILKAGWSSQVNLQVPRSLRWLRVASWTEMLQWIHGLEKFMFHEPGEFM